MKFNVFKKQKNRSITNYAGAKAYTLSPELELYSVVVTTSLEKMTYETDNKRYKRIKSLIRKCNANFVAKLAIYTRTQMNLRSIPIVLVVELAKIHKGDNLVSETLYRIIQRADEITEVLAYYQATNKREDTKKLHRLSKQIQKGVAMAFNKFDEYQLAKYNRKTEVTLKDALFLTHPKAKDEHQQLLFNKLVEDNLDIPFTWEVGLSQLGQQAFKNDKEKTLAFKVKWEELIDSNKLGYMALLRNLRNILQADVSVKHIEKIVGYLGNTNAVLNSKQLPFRFLSAYRELALEKSSYTAYILEALEKAIKISAENIRGFGIETRLLIACDVSGSMYKTISPKSKVMLYDVGLVLAMLLQNRSKNTITGLFGDRFMTYTLPKDSILRNVADLRRIEGKVGYSTNGYKVISYLKNNRKVVDKVMLFTDLQLWNNSYYDEHIENEWNAYKRDIAPNAKLYLFDLAGYGQSPLQVLKKDVYLIAGWSDKVFNVLEALENNKSMLSEIKKIEI